MMARLQGEPLLRAAGANDGAVLARMACFTCAEVVAARFRRLAQRRPR